ARKDDMASRSPFNGNSSTLPPISMSVAFSTSASRMVEAAESAISALAMSESRQATAAASPSTHTSTYQRIPTPWLSEPYHEVGGAGAIGDRIAAKTADAATISRPGRISS